MVNKKYLYFRTTNPEENRAHSSTFPVSRIRGIIPSAVGKLKIYFEPMARVMGDNENVINDYIIFNVTAGKMESVQRKLVDAITSNKLGEEGLRIVVADDNTKNYLHGDITGIGAAGIVHAAAVS